MIVILLPDFWGAKQIQLIKTQNRLQETRRGHQTQFYSLCFYWTLLKGRACFHFLACKIGWWDGVVWIIERERGFQTLRKQGDEDLSKCPTWNWAMPTPLLCFLNDSAFRNLAQSFSHSRVFILLCRPLQKSCTKDPNFTDWPSHIGVKGSRDIPPCLLPWWETLVALCCLYVWRYGSSPIFAWWPHFSSVLDTFPSLRGKCDLGRPPCREWT